MMWFVRCLLWGAPLAILAYQLAGIYHRALLTSATGVFGLTPSREALAAVDLSAANVLAMYAAMCLASRRVPWKRRLRGLAIGLAVLILVEWVSGVFGLWTIVAQARTGAWPAGAERFRDGFLDLLRWISVPLAWLILFGRKEFPALANGFLPSVGARQESPPPTRRARSVPRGSSPV